MCVCVWLSEWVRKEEGIDGDVGEGVEIARRRRRQSHVEISWEETDGGRAVLAHHKSFSLVQLIGFRWRWMSGYGERGK